MDFAHGQPPKRQKSTDAIVAEVLSSLETKPGTDLDLLEILKGTIVSSRTQYSAQIDALQRIEALAKRRAALPKK